MHVSSALPLPNCCNAIIIMSVADEAVTAFDGRIGVLRDQA
jgi:hypothetical protein